MAIISLDPETPILYTPKADGNMGSKKPCVIELYFLSYAKNKRISVDTARKNKDMDNVDVLMEIQKQTLLQSIGDIKGYKVDKKEVTDKERFFETASIRLIEELLLAIENISRLTEKQVKNS